MKKPNPKRVSQLPVYRHYFVDPSNGEMDYREFQIDPNNIPEEDLDRALALAKSLAVDWRREADRSADPGGRNQ